MMALMELQKSTVQMYMIKAKGDVTMRVALKKAAIQLQVAETTARAKSALIRSATTLMVCLAPAPSMRLVNLPGTRSFVCVLFFSGVFLVGSRLYCQARRIP